MREKIENLITSLKEMVDQIESNLPDEKILEKEVQLNTIERSIKQLERKNIPIPTELQNLKLTLILETERVAELNNNINYLYEGIIALLNRLSNHIKRPKNNYKNGPSKVFYDSPDKLIIYDKEIAIRKWNEVLINTANWIIDNGRKLPLEISYGRNFLISSDPQKLKLPKVLKNKLHIATKYPRKSSVSLAARLLKDCGFERKIYVITKRGNVIKPNDQNF